MNPQFNGLHPLAQPVVQVGYFNSSGSISIPKRTGYSFMLTSVVVTVGELGASSSLAVTLSGLGDNSLTLPAGAMSNHLVHRISSLGLSEFAPKLPAVCFGNGPSNLFGLSATVFGTASYSFYVEGFWVPGERYNWVDEGGGGEGGGGV